MAAERASQRLAFLAEASGTLASSLDLDATLRAISQLVVPRLADVCIVSLVASEGQGERHEMAWAASDSEHPLLTASMADTGAVALDEAIVRVRESGRAETLRPADARIPLPRGVTVHALMLTPLVVRGRRLGVLSLGLESSERRFASDALAMVGDLSTRAATAIDNALLLRKIQDEDQRKSRSPYKNLQTIHMDRMPCSLPRLVPLRADSLPARVPNTRDLQAFESQASSTPEAPFESPPALLRRHAPKPVFRANSNE